MQLIHFFTSDRDRTALIRLKQLEFCCFIHIPINYSLIIPYCILSIIWIVDVKETHKESNSWSSNEENKATATNDKRFFNTLVWNAILLTLDLQLLFKLVFLQFFVLLLPKFDLRRYKSLNFFNILFNCIFTLKSTQRTHSRIRHILIYSSQSEPLFCLVHSNWMKSWIFVILSHMINCLFINLLLFKFFSFFLFIDFFKLP